MFGGGGGGALFSSQQVKSASRGAPARGAPLSKAASKGAPAIRARGGGGGGGGGPQMLGSAIRAKKSRAFSESDSEQEDAQMESM